ncbi:MAG: hypothetical protein LV481_00895 [Methylacidiphilales bacterium]|nr:hypothetical protein [Candidatus Methylacidiphilales bacterium]
MAIALAVVSLALIALLGLISVSLQSSKNANHDTEIALASEYAISTLTTNTFANLATVAPATNYFDYQGSPTTQSSTTDPAVFNCITQTSTNMAPFSWADTNGVSNPNLIAVELTFTWLGQTNTTGNNAKTIWTSISAY